MFCADCGAKISKGKYCKNCGHRIEESKIDSTESKKTDLETSKKSTDTPKQKSSGCLTFFLIGCGLIFLLVLIGGFFGAKKYIDGIRINGSPTPTSTKTTKSKTPTPKSTEQNRSTNDSDDLYSVTPEPAATDTPATVDEPRRMYYWVGCGDCQNPSCQESYHYAGWDERDWLDNRTACLTCTCNDVKARSYYP